ncbi:MAG TPA: Fic family protein [Streptosporangiaceae bacterium]|nr:Fic family protein [Streptosporangiaceae bacterium]
MRSPACTTGAPRTAADLAELEASYQPFAGAAAWRRTHVDEPRLSGYAGVLSRAVAASATRPGDAGSPVGTDLAEVKDRLLRVASLDSMALDDLLPANPELTSVVLASAIDGGAEGAEDTGAIDAVAECQRQALVLASEAATAGRAVDVQLIAVLQDVITKTQVSYTVTTDQGDSVEVALPRGQYKPVSNYLRQPDGRLAAFAPADQVAAEMDRLVGELGSAAFAGLHPVVQAAYAHYALTAIHPFADANGRLARTVASIYLIRFCGLPLLVFADQWPGYYQALREATQRRRGQALVDFFAAAAVAAMDLAASLLSPPGEPLGQGGGDASAERAPGEVDEAAAGLLAAVAAELRQLVVSPSLDVSLAVTPSRPDHAEPGYRLVAGAGLRFAVRGRRAPVDLEFVPLASEMRDDLLPVAVREVRTGALFEAAFADAYPLVLPSTAIRARLWLRRLLAQ